mmetsp:Transcript_9122/g.22353  ORF Transcript_9122/g.22353 Transcript_9122/m.22353 type:complete len:200 (-) Transcript_9122:40-639(-)
MRDGRFQTRHESLLHRIGVRVHPGREGRSMVPKHRNRVLQRQRSKALQKHAGKREERQGRIVGRRRAAAKRGAKGIDQRLGSLQSFPAEVFEEVHPARPGGLLRQVRREHRARRPSGGEVEQKEPRPRHRHGREGLLGGVRMRPKDRKRNNMPRSSRGVGLGPQQQCAKRTRHIATAKGNRGEAKRSSGRHRSRRIRNK